MLHFGTPWCSHLIFAVTLLQVGVSNIHHSSTDCIRHHPDRDFYNRLQSCFRLHQTQDDAQHSDAGAALPTRQISINAHTSMRRTWVSLKLGTLLSLSAASPARCISRAAAFRCISVSLSDSEPGVSGRACSLNSYNGVQLCHVCLFFIFSNWRYCTCACGVFISSDIFYLHKNERGIRPQMAAAGAESEHRRVSSSSRNS